MHQQVAGTEARDVLLPLHNTRNRGSRRSSATGALCQSGRGTLKRKRCPSQEGIGSSANVDGNITDKRRGRGKPPLCVKRMQRGAHSCEQGPSVDAGLVCGECAAGIPKTSEVVCAACRRGVDIGDDGKPQWAHFRAEELARARVLVEEGIEPLGDDVVEGFAPHLRMCFCTWKSCFYAAYTRMKKADVWRAQDACDVCKVMVKGESRCAGDCCAAMQTFYGVSIGSGSIICQACRMRYVTQKWKAKEAGGFVADSVSSTG